jgi:hypothetical protein
MATSGESSLYQLCRRLAEIKSLMIKFITSVEQITAILLFRGRITYQEQITAILLFRGRITYQEQITAILLLRGRITYQEQITAILLFRGRITYQEQINDGCRGPNLFLPQFHILRRFAYNASNPFTPLRNLRPLFGINLLYLVYPHLFKQCFLMGILFFYLSPFDLRPLLGKRLGHKTLPWCTTQAKSLLSRHCIPYLLLMT